MSKEKLHATAITELLAEKLSLSKRVADDFVKAMIVTIEEALLANDVVKLKGLGTFKLQWNAPRKSVDVNTGNEIVIDGYYRVVFIPENELKESVNEPYAHLEPVLLSDEGEEVLSENKTVGDGDDDDDEAVVPLKLFNEQADEIKELMSEINALNHPNEPALPKKTVESEPPRVAPPTIKLRHETIQPTQTTKSIKRSRRTMDYLFIAGMVGGLLVYILVEYDAFSFFTSFLKSNKMQPTTEYYQPMTNPVVAPVDTAVSDTTSFQIEDSMSVMDTTVDNAGKPIDQLQVLFDQPRVYKEFIGTEEVIPGSRLTRIAERHYGVKEFWVYIYEANSDLFTHPDQVAVGMFLKIPKLNPILADKDNPRCMEYALQLQDEYLMY